MNKPKMILKEISVSEDNEELVVFLINKIYLKKKSKK